MKFDEITKQCHIGAKVEYIKNYTFLATVYVTNGNQSNTIVIGSNSYSTLAGAKGYCERILGQIAEVIRRMRN